MSDEIAKIEWNDSYLLSVPEIDQQHKQRISIANELYDVATGDESVYETKMPVILKKLKSTHDFFVREINFQVKKLENMNKADVLNFFKYIVN